MLPKLAAALDADIGAATSHEALRDRFHAHGVNMRYVLRVAALCTSPAARQRLCREAVVRAAKHKVRALWRGSASEAHCKALTDAAVAALSAGAGWEDVAAGALELFGGAWSQEGSAVLADLRAAVSERESWSWASQLRAALGDAECLKMKFVAHPAFVPLEQAEERLQAALSLAETRAAQANDAAAVMPQLSALMRLYNKAVEGADVQLEKGAQVAQRILDIHASARPQWEALRDVEYFFSLNQELARAEELARLLLQHMEDTGAVETDDAVETMLRLALTVKALDRLDEAEALYRRALAVAERLAGGKPNGDVAMVLGNLGSLSMARGDYGEARALRERALAMREALFGRENVEVATDLSNLAQIAYRQKRHAEALTLFEECLALRQRLLGSAHSAVMQTRSSMAVVLRDLGRLDEAAAHLTEVAAAEETLYGENNAQRAATLNNLGDVRMAQGRLDEAEQLLQRALAIRRAAFGPDHTSCATSLGNLAMVQLQRGAQEDARASFAEALRIRRAALGDAHAMTRLALRNLAATLGDMGRVEERDALVAEFGTTFEALCAR